MRSLGLDFAIQDLRALIKQLDDAKESLAIFAEEEDQLDYSEKRLMADASANIRLLVKQLANVRQRLVRKRRADEFIRSTESRS